MTSDKYEVGYGKPPRDKQWQKGQSGNPGGRPRKKLDFADDAIEVFLEPLPAGPGNQSKEFNTYSAMFRASCNKALGGNDSALKAVLEYILEMKAAGPEAASFSFPEVAGARERLAKMLARAGGDTPGAAEATRSRPASKPIVIPRHAHIEIDAMAKMEQDRLLKLHKDNPGVDV